MFDSKEGPLFASPRLGSNAMSMEVALNRADRVYRPGVRGGIDSLKAWMESFLNRGLTFSIASFSP